MNNQSKARFLWRKKKVKLRCYHRHVEFKPSGDGYFCRDCERFLVRENGRLVILTIERLFNYL